MLISHLENSVFFKSRYDQFRTKLQKKCSGISKQIQIIFGTHQGILNPSCDICWEDIEEIDMDIEFGSNGNSSFVPSVNPSLVTMISSSGSTKQTT